MKLVLVAVAALASSGVSAQASEPTGTPDPWDPIARFEGESFKKPATGETAASVARLPASGPAAPARSGGEASFIPSSWYVTDCTNYSDGRIECPDESEESAPTEAARAPTQAEIRREVREIAMPALSVNVQPGDRTLVHVPTILYAQPRAVNRTVDLLGYEIEVEARATSFTWHHGDGTSRTTSEPGRPYPSKDVTHTYQRAADVVRPRVDTTYTVRYRIGDGTWTDLGETLTATGTPTSLRVRQAAPVLTRP